MRKLSDRPRLFEDAIALGHDVNISRKLCLEGLYGLR